MRVGIIEDHDLFRETISDVVSAMPGHEVTFSVGTTAAALLELQRGQTDLALVDLSLGDDNGIDLVRQITERWPQVRSIIVSGHRRWSYAEQALAAGAAGYILKGDPQQFHDGISAVAAGGSYVSASVRPPPAH